MELYDNPLNIDEQVELMKKYVVFSKKVKMRRFLNYAGYFRASRYGKFVISYSNSLGHKPNQELLFNLYEFDTRLREILVKYCKRAEIQFKSYVSNAISLELKTSTFYLNEEYYTSTKGERDRKKKNANKRKFNKFIENIKQHEHDLKTNVLRYPELRDYRNGGQRNQFNIPSWAAFSYFELGTITHIYSYLNGKLRKKVLKYGYARERYGKEVTKQVDTWLDAVRNLRNICAHHNKLVGKTSSVVLADNVDDSNILESNTDLFSRLYALKKILRKEDSENLKKDLKRLINKTKFDIYLFKILPVDWEEKYDRINYL